MKVVVIGGGIIGLCSAYYLLQEGHEVIILEKGDGDSNCSSGNLGMLVPSHFVPLASPGIISKGLKWLLNAQSPFYIRPSFNKQILSWGWKFMKSATQNHCNQSAHPLLAFNLLSRELYETLQQNDSFDFNFIKKGLIMYYHTDEAAEEEIHTALKAQEMGLDVEILTKNELQLLEPSIELNVTGGVHYKCDAHLNPNKLIQQLRSYLQQNGVVISTNSEVQQFVTDKMRISKVITNGQEIKADIVVLATGAWMPELAKKLGISIPMIAGKGYTFNTHNTPELNIPCILSEARVAITPMGNSIRYGGTMEIGKMNAAINMKRVQGIVDSANKYFSNVNLQMPSKENVWYGHRPCSPDGLPYIGHLKKYANVIIAGGHSMMGLSLGLATGKTVSLLATNQPVNIDISLFNPERFN